MVSKSDAAVEFNVADDDGLGAEDEVLEPAPLPLLTVAVEDGAGVVCAPVVEDALVEVLPEAFTEVLPLPG